jgi:hypothetical protein
MRLNLFLPYLRRPKRDRAIARPFRSVGLTVLPEKLFSQADLTVRPGWGRRVLAAMGPTWLSAPVRRVVQAICFVAFCWLFFYVLWPYGVPDHAAQMAVKEKVPAVTFLAIDPLVSLSTAIAAKSWVWSLTWAAGILLVCVLFPRGFCGYLCPSER